MADLSGFNLVKAGVMAESHSGYDENPRLSFIDELKSYGFKIYGAYPEIDRIVKFAVPGDKGQDKAGWYWYDEFEDQFRPGLMVGVGVFGNYRDGLQDRIVWSSKRQTHMSPTEAAFFNEQVERAKINRQIEQEQTQRDASIQCTNIWSNAEDVTSHPYLTAKGILPHGTRIHDDKLLVPVIINDEITSLQRITLAKKLFFPGGKVSGGYYRLGEPSDVVYVVEGFATAASVHEATDGLTYCAFNAGNLLNVANTAKDQNPESNVVICGDDDAWKESNTGRIKATAAGEATQCRAIFPEFKDTTTQPVDFNDLHALEGLGAVRKIICEKPALYVQKTDYQDMPASLLTPPGILSDIVNYYNTTARAPQPGFAIQTALAIGSVVLGRNYRTTKGNHTSLYFLNIAKSGTGKEHTKTVIEDILCASGMDGYINGSGYTSAGAVFSTLLRTPKHITVIDEFGRYLEAAQGQKNSNLMEANTQLMEAIGRCHGVLRPSSYSTMTLTKDKADDMARRHIKNPAITLVCMTTPVAFFNNLRSDAVADGFLGRFIIHHSNMPRMVHDDKDTIDVPHKIVDWIERIRERVGYHMGYLDIASDIPQFITMPFHGDSLPLLRVFSQECVDLANQLERHHLEALPGRAKEMAMRIAIIVELSCDPAAEVVHPNSVQWAIDYVRFSVRQSVSVLKMRMSGSAFEADKKEILQSLRDAGKVGVSWSEMQKIPPFSKHKKRDLGDIMDALIAAELVINERVQTGKRGRPRESYIAIQ